MGSRQVGEGGGHGGVGGGKEKEEVVLASVVGRRRAHRQGQGGGLGMGFHPRDREKQEQMGVYDSEEYLNEVNWPDKKLKKGYKLEMLFEYPEEGETKLIWCPGIVLKVVKRDDKVIKAEIKWDSDFIGEGEGDETTEKLKKNMWNREKPKQGAWREDLRHKLRKIN